MHKKQRTKAEQLKTKSLARQAHGHATQSMLRILATTDLHMNLTSFDYYADRPDQAIGLTRTASLIRAARQEARQSGAEVLLFDNGDALQGTLLGDWAADQPGPQHPLLSAFEKLDYDAIALGNHDFSFGLPVLEAIVEHAPFPVLCGNLRRMGRTQAWQPWAVLTRRIRVGGQEVPLRVGVFSILPPQTARWEAHHLDGEVEVADSISTARTCIAELRDRGCDLVIALAHSGLGDAEPAPMSENVVIQLAALEGVDAIVAGHTHMLFPADVPDPVAGMDLQNGLIHGKPVVMPGTAGTHLGVIDLTLERDATGWNIVAKSGRLRSVRPAHPDAGPVPEDPEMMQVFQAGHARTRRRAASPVGRTEQDMHSFFTFCGLDRGLTLVAAAQAAALRPVLKGSELEDLPLLSSVAPSKFGGRAGPRHFTDVARGDVFLRHVFDLHVFPNELRAVVVTGAQLRDWLEMSAAVYRHIDGAREADLIDPQATGHNFDVLHGVTYEIDPSCPPRFDLGGHRTGNVTGRIRNLCHHGTPVSPDQAFVVAVNNYRANGGGNFPIPRECPAIQLPRISIGTVIRDYLSGALERDPLEDAPASFSLTGFHGRATVLRTGPGAAKYLDELAAFNPEPLGLDDQGFLRIRLWP